MDKKTGRILAGIALTCLLCSPAALAAGLTNDSAGSEEVAVYMSDGRVNRTVMFPGQNLRLPRDTIKVKVVAPRFDRGDEDINFIITETDGRIGIIDHRGGTYTLNLPEDLETPIALRAGSVLNSSNMAVNVIVTRRSGIAQNFSLYLNQSITLGLDVVSIEVGSDPRSSEYRGDEEIAVDVILPDGSQGTLTAVGEKILLKEEAL